MLYFTYKSFSYSFQKGVEKTQEYVSFDIFTKKRKSFFLENFWVFTDIFSFKNYFH